MEMNLRWSSVISEAQVKGILIEGIRPYFIQKIQKTVRKVLQDLLMNKVTWESKKLLNSNSHDY